MGAEQVIGLQFVGVTEGMGKQLCGGDTGGETIQDPLETCKDDALFSEISESGMEYFGEDEQRIFSQLDSQLR